MIPLQRQHIARRVTHNVYKVYLECTLVLTDIPTKVTNTTNCSHSHVHTIASFIMKNKVVESHQQWVLMYIADFYGKQ